MGGYELRLALYTGLFGGSWMDGRGIHTAGWRSEQYFLFYFYITYGSDAYNPSGIHNIVTDCSSDG